MSCIGIQSISMATTIYWIQHTKKNRTRKNGDKDGKALHKLMNNSAYNGNNGNFKK